MPNKSYRIVIELEADETDRLLDTESVRLIAAEAIVQDFRPGRNLRHEAPITRVRVDGRDFSFDSLSLEQTPITAEIAEWIAQGRVVQAIRLLRENNPGMGLLEAKELVDKWRASR